MAESIDGIDAQDFSLPGGGYLVDADTFTTNEGKRVRIKGINAYETQKVGDTASSIKPSELGADTQRLFTHKIISDGGYNIPVTFGAKDKYDRELGDLANADGELLSTYLLKNGLTNTLMPTQQDIAARDAGGLERAIAKSQGLAPTLGTQMLDLLNEERNQAPLMGKMLATDAKQYGASLDENGKSEYYSGPGAIRSNENANGEARSNLWTGLESGFESMKQGAWASLGLIGDVTESKDIQDMAARNVNAIQSNLQDLPYLRSGEAFGEDGKWKLDGFMKTADWLLGTAASSAPQMIASMGAVALAPMTFGVSLSLPAVLYTGTTYNAQETKNPLLAITSGVTQATLETLSLGRITGSIFSKATQKEVVSNLLKKGYTEEAAEKALLGATQKAVKDVADAQKLIASQQARRVGRASLEGVLTETPTEAAQEYAQYVGETGQFSPDTPEGMIKLQNRLLNAAAGGFALGGAFGGGGRLIANVLTPSAVANPVMGESEFRNILMDRLQVVPDTEDVINDIKPDHTATIEDLAIPETNRRTASGLAEKATDWIKNEGGGSLWKKWSTSIMKNDTTAGLYTATLSTLLGVNRAVNGGSIEEKQRDVIAAVGSKFVTMQALSASFGNIKNSQLVTLLGKKTIQDTISRVSAHMEIFNARTPAKIAEGLDVASLLSDDNKQYAPGIVALTTKVSETLKEYNRVTQSTVSMEEFLNNYSVNKDKVARSRSQFTQLLQTHLKLTSDQANEAYLSITDNQHVNSLEDLFDPFVNMNNPLINIKGDPKQALNSPDVRSAFMGFLNSDILSNAGSLAGRAGAVYANKFLIGNKGSHLAALLESAVAQKEITDERASAIAYQLKDWLDMREGKYNRIDNPYIKGALSLVNFLSTVSSLPLAAVSSTVEFAQVYRHLNLPQGLKATRYLLEGVGQEMAKILEVLGKQPKANNYETSLFQAGLLQDGNIGRRNDVMVNYFSKWTEGFFKMTGLTSMTNVTRYAKLSIASDAMSTWLDTVRKGDRLNPDQSAIDAREHLSRIGVDVDFCINLDGEMDPATQQKFSDEMSRGAHSFVAEAVITPSKLNRPKFYSDPYLQLFTQFQGYTSAFTANVLPLLLKDLNKRGSADQANAAAAIAMMFALAYMAAYLKDMIKYGESPPEWLKDDKKFQRYIGQVGILGTGQRIWDTFSPILQDNQRKSVAASGVAALTDQSPALSFLSKVNDALSAPAGSQISKTARLLPVFGTSPAFAKELQKVLGE